MKSNQIESNRNGFKRDESDAAANFFHITKWLKYQMWWGFPSPKETKPNEQINYLLFVFNEKMVHLEK